MRTPRLRLYTKNVTYLRMIQGALNLHDPAAIEKTERLIASYTRAPHAVLTSMGRTAIYEGLRALGAPGEIILSPITVPEVISMVILAGFTPVFCDVEPGTWNMDVALAATLISERTTAIMTTHFYGSTNTTRAVRALCDRHDLWMIEDAAQAIGAWQGGEHAGTVGDFGILSFSYPKNVTSFYGGCLITGHAAIAESVRERIRHYPPVRREWLYKKAMDCAIKDCMTFGPVFQPISLMIRHGYRKNIPWIKSMVTQELNAVRLEHMPTEYIARLSPAQAQAVADKWPEVDEDVLHRIRCAEIYHHHLKDVPGLLCADLWTDKSHTYLYFPIQVADKYALQHFMIEHDCDVAIQHAANCADLPAYKEYYRDCPAARAAYAGTLMLPTYRGFPLAQAERYARTVRRFFGV